MGMGGNIARRLDLIRTMNGEGKVMENWPATSTDTVYDFSFTAYPDPQHPRMVGNAAVFEFFKVYPHRVVMEFTEAAFGSFREDMAKAGFELHEIEKVPHLHPVNVI